MFGRPQGGGAGTAGGKVSDKLLQHARASGQLNLSNRGLTCVPENVWRINLDTDKRVDYSFDSKERWWDQADLTKLILASNALTSLPADIANLPALTVLDAHDNHIETIDPAIGELAALCTLHLGTNTLTELPGALCTLLALKVLRVDHNHLSALPANIGTCASLEELHAQHNQLQALPPSLCACGRLRQLTLSHNALTSLPAGLGANLSLLEQLELSYNRLAKLPPDLARLGRITRLDLRHNALTQPPTLTSASALRELYLGFNRLTTLGDCGDFPPSLQVLDVGDNHLTELPSGISRLCVLERLDVSNNDLIRLPAQLGGISTLKSLVLDGNSLKTIRRDIVGRGTLAVLKHLRNHLASADAEEQREAEQAARVDEVRRVQTDARQGAVVEYSRRNADLIPDEVWAAATGEPVARLTLSHNRLRDLPAGADAFAATLTHLDMSHNKLARLSPAVVLLKRLRTLNLTGNALSELPADLALLTDLADLAIGYNAFCTIPECVYDCTALETLVANDCAIVELNAERLATLSLLSCLDLSNNQIRTVPPKLGLCQGLKALKLQGNAFKIPRPAVLAKGTPALLAYLKDRIPQ